MIIPISRPTNGWAKRLLRKMIEPQPYTATVVGMSKRFDR
jgi:hypothetical protein